MKLPSSPPPMPDPAQQRGSIAPKKKSISPETCAWINVLAFPGLGTILAKQPRGFVQALMMLVGFGLFVCNFILFIHETYVAFQAGAVVGSPGASVRWMAWWGGGTCLVSWMWSGVSSLRMCSRKSRDGGLAKPD